MPQPATSPPPTSPSPTSPAATDGARPARRSATGLALGLLVFALAAVPVLVVYLVRQPSEIWQVDLEVYRAGAQALLRGESLYAMRTPAPQLLPFTYPPFAALVGLPLAVVPFGAAGWLWSALQLALLWVSVGIAFGPALRRAGRWAGLGQGVLCGGAVWLMPVTEGFRFGQVNAVIVVLCLVDLARPPQARSRWWAQGWSIGCAAAIKLTPATFWLHLAQARRWRLLASSVAAAAAVTLGAALVAPAASAAYWGSALLDPGRLGPNAGTSNQSLRGTLLRLGPDGAAGTAIWLLAVLIVLVAGLRLAGRLHRAGEQVAVVGAVGLVAFLISPVSWVHHLHWAVVVLGAVLGDGRRLRRVLTALAGAALLWMRLPWWGASMLAGDWPRWFARLVQNADTWWALAALVALALLVPGGDGRDGRAPVRAP